MKTNVNFLNATCTVAGYEVKNLRIAPDGGIYGMVADPQWARPDRPFTTAYWKRNGKCGNRTRPDCDLATPKA